jgi:hypothetical protein
MSAIAFSWGEEIIEAGERDPALLMGAIKARKLGVRCGILPEETLRQAK